MKLRNPTKSLGLATAGVCVLLSASSQAQVISLQHNNSFAQVDIGTPVGMFNWSVDGSPSQLARQWFWYRAGAMNNELPINSIGLTSFSTPTTNILDTTYNNGLFSVTVRYTLQGGSLGSGVSDIGEQITINNNTANPLQFHFFQYSDFNLGGPASDSVVLSTSLFDGLYHIADQFQNPIGITETVVSPGANHAEAAPVGVTLASLLDGLPTTLSDVTFAPPGDNTWAFQWDLLIAPGGSEIISKDKRLRINAVPEPTLFSLLSVGLLAVVLRRRRE